jgi:predicted dehydrogenase
MERPQAWGRARVYGRRAFLKALAAGGAAVAFPTIVRAKALGKDGAVAASDRIALGNIGVGGRGGFLLGWFLADSDVQVRVVCDVDASRREAARKRVDVQYGGTGAGVKNCDACGDFREVLARGDIDGVVVAAPDHWHAMLTILAARAGKDVYCEKPMASVIADGRAAADAVRRYGRVFQTGSHERSTASVRYACELVRNGRIGKVHTIRTFLPTGDKHSRADGPVTVPEGFDYDRWLGPAPWAAYHPQRCHGNFRWVTDYSDGELTDRGAHVNDIALLGAGPLLTGPVEIEGTGKCIDDPIWDVPYEYHIEFTYASGLKIIVDSGGPESGRGIRFEGTDGWIFVAIHGGALSASSPSILKSKIDVGEVQLGRSIGHGADWLHAIRTRGPTMAPAEEGHRTASFCHLSLVAVLLRRKLKWDLQREVFLDDEEANHMPMIRRPMREPWCL